MYREYQPCGLLAPYVDKIWEFKGSPEYGMRINVLPDGCTDLIFALGGITQPVGNEGRIMPSCGTDETLFGVGRVYRNGSHGWYSFSSLRIIPIHGLARAGVGRSANQ